MVIANKRMVIEKIIQIKLKDSLDKFKAEKKLTTCSLRLVLKPILTINLSHNNIYTT